MTIVVDASIAATWALTEESTPWTRAVRTAVINEGMIVPWLFWFEIRNSLLTNERRGRIEATDSDKFLHDLFKMVVDFDSNPDGLVVMSIARSHQLTAYDAAYLELASRRKLPLCTLDKQLIAAAPKSGVSLWPR